MVVRAWEVFAENSSRSPASPSSFFILLFCFVGPHIYVTNQTSTDLLNYLCRPSGAHLARLRRPRLRPARHGLMVGGQISLEWAWRRQSSLSWVGTLYGAISGFAGGFSSTRS